MKSYKGQFTPVNPNKYLGDPKGIIYRSLLEKRFMIYCDQTNHIIEWSSEEIIVPYISPIDHRMHRYFPDFWIKVKNKEGEIEEFLIEVKPYSQCFAPNKPKRQTRRYLQECATYAVNQAKWDAAKALCDKKGWNWKVLTERELK